MRQGTSKSKENFEVRFFLTPARADKLLALWRKERRRFKAYSFVDHYFTKGRTQAKIRKWNSVHKPRVEIIFFEREHGLKTEESRPATNFETAMKRLRGQGFSQDLTIYKKKAWLIRKKGMPTYAIEYVPGLGWTGEIEVPEQNKKGIQNHTAYLKRLGASGFTKKSMLQIMKDKQRMRLREKAVVV